MTMKFYPEDLPQWLNKDVFWRTTDQGLVCAFGELSSLSQIPGYATVGGMLDDREINRVIPKSHIDAIHPQLWDALCRISHCKERDCLNKAFEVGCLDSYILRAQLAHLVKPVVVEDRRGYTRNVAEFLRVTDWNAEKRHVSLEGFIYGIASYYPETQSEAVTPVEPFVYGTSVGAVCPTAKWMDEHYPGWDGRLTTAQTLGFNATELLKAAFDAKEVSYVRPMIPDTDMGM